MTTDTVDTLTAWQLYKMMCEQRVRDILSVGLVWVQNTPGILDRKVGGYDFVGAAVEVWHGGQRVYALTEMGEVRGEGWLLAHLGPGHPLADVLAVRDDCEMEVREIE